MESNAALILTSDEGRGKYPPMLEQYLAYKRQYVDTLLLFQVGDFYEVFFEDAVTVSRVINLTLTSRDKNSPNPVPMAGVPISAVDSYIERLVAAGYSVALVSQTGASSTGKGMFERKLDRVVTPGLKILSTNDFSKDEALLAVITFSEVGEYAVLWGSAQSGILEYRDNLTDDEALQLLSRIGPAEVILPKESGLGAKITKSIWGQKVSIKIRNDQVSFAPNSKLTIEGFDNLSSLVKRGLKILCSYLEESMVDPQVVLKKIAPRLESEEMHLDAITRTNLELIRNAKDGSAAGTLSAFLDETVSAGGGRQLKKWLVAPLLSVNKINDRLDRVTFFISKRELRAELRGLLSTISDLERLATRIELLVAGPRELGALRDSLVQGEKIASLLSSESKYKLVSAELFNKTTKLCERLNALLGESLPLAMNEGGIIKDGADAEVDSLRKMRTQGTSWLEELEKKERARTGISSLKIKSNGVIGYFYEITRANAEKIQIPTDYIRRQSTAQAERFTTEELRSKESEVVSAEGKLFARERALFEALRQETRPLMNEVRELAAKLSELDVILSFAEVSHKEGYIRPEVLESQELLIEEGRHPILASTLGRRFVPNSLAFNVDGDTNAKGSYILTGPNMGGKSTYLRQSALIVVMAQIGSFVPARTAKIGIVDRIFARLGASDNLLEGESTFMVEMKEAALILNNATNKSLVLIDELGRGTATEDGLSLAYAIFESLVLNIKCRMLFATHFHELTDLSGVLPNVGNLSVGSVEEEGEVIFTHQIHNGPAEESYGVEVAKLAGLSADITSRAEELLNVRRAEKRSSQLSLFPVGSPLANKPKVQSLPSSQNKEFVKFGKILSEIDLDDTTPKKAHEILCNLKTLLSKN